MMSRVQARPVRCGNEGEVAWGLGLADLERRAAEDRPGSGCPGGLERADGDEDAMTLELTFAGEGCWNGGRFGAGRYEARALAPPAGTVAGAEGRAHGEEVREREMVMDFRRMGWGDARATPGVGRVGDVPKGWEGDCARSSASVGDVGETGTRPVGLDEGDWVRGCGTEVGLVGLVARRRSCGLLRVQRGTLPFCRGRAVSESRVDVRHAPPWALLLRAEEDRASPSHPLPLWTAPVSTHLHRGVSRNIKSFGPWNGIHFCCIHQRAHTCAPRFVTTTSCSIPPSGEVRRTRWDPPCATSTGPHKWREWGRTYAGNCNSPFPPHTHECTDLLSIVGHAGIDQQRVKVKHTKNK